MRDLEESRKMEERDEENFVPLWVRKSWQLYGLEEQDISILNHLNGICPEFNCPCIFEE